MYRLGLISKLKRDSEDNKGSVLITVLVAFLFISVLVAIILSTVAVNFRMRAMDRYAKDEFYYCEKALEDIYTGLGIECSELMGASYNKVLGNATDKAGYDVENEKYAIEQFNRLFSEGVKKIFEGDKLNKKLSGYIVGTGPQKRVILEGDPEVVFNVQLSDNTVVEKKMAEMVTTDDFKRVKAIVLKDVIVKSNTSSSENNGYASAISTDIVIEMPKLDFITVNKRWFDYSVVANDGIEIEGNTNIEGGNVYGGALTEDKISTAFAAAKASGNDYSSKDYGGINVQNGEFTFSGDYLVSGGDINVIGNDAKLTVGNNGTECQVWFENVVVSGKKAIVNIDDNVSLYAFNDLEIASSAEESTFTMGNGSYYGYNPGKYSEGPLGAKTKESIIKKDDVLNSNAESSNSSAVIINAKKATVDMSNIQTFVLLGNAFINHSSKAPSVVHTSGDDADFYTLESASLKANQEIYLVPSEFLNTSNPTYAESIGAADVNIDPTWFAAKKDASGKSMLADVPYKSVYVKNASGKNVGYVYLNFRDDEKRAEYVKTIMAQDENGASPTGKELYERLKRNGGLQASQLIIGDGTGKTHIYARNAILQYRNGEPKLEENLKGIDRFEGYSKNMMNKFRWLDTYLDPQADRSLTNIDKDTPPEGGNEVKTMNYPLSEVNANDFKNEDLPLSRLVWLGKASASESSNKLPGINHPGVRNLPAASVKDPIVPTDPVSGEPQGDVLPGKVIVSNGDITLPSTENPLKAFIIADGDVTVPAGLKVEGFIFASGKVIFKGSNTVTFNSALLEQRIEKEIEYVKRDLKDRVNKNSAYKNYYLISYLLDIDAEDGGIASRTDDPQVVRDLKYYYGSDAGAQEASDINTDYRKFISYENWKKGQIQK